MSGGHFEYNQYRILQIAESVRALIDSNGDNEWQDYSPATLEEFKRGEQLLRRAYVYAQRIDWLVSGDDGEVNFHKRLADDLEKL